MILRQTEIKLKLTNKIVFDFIKAKGDKVQDIQAYFTDMTLDETLRMAVKSINAQGHNYSVEDVVAIYDEEDKSLMTIVQEVADALQDYFQKV